MTPARSNDAHNRSNRSPDIRDRKDSTETLKERVIGIELLAVPQAYDTGEDAIVRVTASDVRKRLLQHYGKDGSTSEFRISLPLGAYVPEIARRTRSSANGNFHHSATEVEPIKWPRCHIRTCCMVRFTRLLMTSSSSLPGRGFAPELRGCLSSSRSAPLL